MELELEITSISKKVKQASYLVYLSLILGLIKSILYETMTNQKVLTDPNSLTIGIFSILIMGFIGFKIGQGKNWARITLLILYIIGMLGFPFLILNEFEMNPLIGVVSVAQILIQLYVLIILFTGESKDWFNSKKIKTTPNSV